MELVLHAYYIHLLMVEMLIIFGMRSIAISGLCHAETCLRIFVIVLPNEGLAGGTPPIVLLV